MPLYTLQVLLSFAGEERRVQTTTPGCIEVSMSQHKYSRIRFRQKRFSRTSRKSNLLLSSSSSCFPTRSTLCVTNFKTDQSEMGTSNFNQVEHVFPFSHSDKSKPSISSLFCCWMLQDCELPCWLYLQALRHEPFRQVAVVRCYFGRAVFVEAAWFGFNIMLCHHRTLADHRVTGISALGPPSVGWPFIPHTLLLAVRSSKLFSLRFFFIHFPQSHTAMCNVQPLIFRFQINKHNYK